MKISSDNFAKNQAIRNWRHGDHCIIRQPAGIGDILFTQKIAKLLLKKGDYKKIMWPVISEYNYLHDYIGTDNILFIDENHDFVFKEIYQSDSIEMVEYEVTNGNFLDKGDHKVLYIPLQHADQCPRALLPDYRAHGQMKYKYVGINHSDDEHPWSNWVDYIIINRIKVVFMQVKLHLYKA